MAKTSSVLLALAVCVRAPAVEEPKGAVDASFAVPTGRPILCTRTMRLTGAMKVTSGAGDQDVAMAIEEEIRFIDEHSVLTRDREEATRYFVRAESKANGEINDPPLSGIEVSFTRNSEGVRLVIKNDRTLPQEMIEDLLEASDSAGIWLDFPADGKIGESYKIDLAPLGPLLLSGGLCVRGNGQRGGGRPLQGPDRDLPHGAGLLPLQAHGRPEGVRGRGEGVREGQGQPEGGAMKGRTST